MSNEYEHDIDFNPNEGLLGNYCATLEPLGYRLITPEDNQDELLPDSLVNNPDFRRQVQQRQTLVRSLQSIFDRLPDMRQSWDRAFHQRYVSASMLEKAYTQLTTFLTSDENHARIILYLPAEVLPDVTQPIHSHSQLEKSRQNFAQAYRHAWHYVLGESNIRGSFVDGDVLEPGMGEPQRVRKAGHLLPDMLTHGLIKPKEIINLISHCYDEELVQSLVEGCIAASDRGVFTSSQWRELSHATKHVPNVYALYSTVIHHSPHIPQDITHDVIDHPKATDWLQKKISEVDSQLNHITDRYINLMSSYDTVSRKRRLWEMGLAKDQCIEEAAGEIANKLRKGILTIRDIRALMDEQDELFVTLMIRSIVAAGDEQALHNELSPDLITNGWQMLIELWQTSPQYRDEVYRGLSHWFHARLLPSDVMEKLRIHIPDLSAALSVVRTEFNRQEIPVLSMVVEAIHKNPVLSRLVYPYVISFGSRMKGYATSNADIDLGLFVRPTTTWEDQEKLSQAVQSIRESNSQIDSFVTFWIDKSGNGWTFRYPPVDYPGLKTAGIDEIHFLFGAMWYGKNLNVQSVYRNILSLYVDLSRYGEKKENARLILLRQLEHDVLQYRLMHKGYRQLYPNRRAAGTPNAHNIDWESDFWDPGYRRVATILFLNRVFLPDLS